LHKNKIAKANTDPHSDLHKEKKEEVREIVKITKDGKEETKEFHGVEKEKHASKSQIKRQKKQVRVILGVLGGIILLCLIIFLIYYQSTHFNYEGLKFKMVREGELTFYQVPMITQYQGSKLTYYFYFRTNPNKLKEVPFDGEIELKNNLILNVTTENLFCDGDWQLSIGNLMNLNIFNIEVGSDENATCDSLGRYAFVRIQEGNESRIEQYGPACYNLYIADCEVLAVTEKFMVETFVKVNEFTEDYQWT